MQSFFISRGIFCNSSGVTRREVDGRHRSSSGGRNPRSLGSLCPIPAGITTSLPNPRFSPANTKEFPGYPSTTFPLPTPRPRIPSQPHGSNRGHREATLEAEEFLLGWNPRKNWSLGIVSGARIRLNQRIGGVAGDAAAVGGVPDHPDVSRVSEIDAPALGTGKGKTQFPVFFWERMGGFGAERMDLWGFQPRVPLRNRGVVEAGREFQEPHPSLECGARDQD